jgi:pimeloyl-ACP methyl ester carboxylesterase
MSDRLDIEVGGIRLACQISGAADGQPMVLLHALGERGADWDRVRAEFDPFYRVLTIDFRGHGDSDWPRHYTYELMRDDVLGILDQLAMDDVMLVGHSLGGVVAYLIAEDHPSRVERLIVEDATPPYPTDRAVPERPDGPLPFDWPVVPAIRGQLNDASAVWWDRLSEITAPTLLIGGGPSSHIAPAKLDEVARRVSQCTLVTIPTGHYVHAAAPAEFAATVLEFLRERQAPS